MSSLPYQSGELISHKLCRRIAPPIPEFVGEMSVTRIMRVWGPESTKRGAAIYFSSFAALFSYSLGDPHDNLHLPGQVLRLCPIDVDRVLALAWGWVW